MVLAMAIFLPWYGFGLSVLWRWFAVPLGVPEIGWAHAAGLLLLLGMTRSRLHKSQPPGGMEWLMYVIWPAIALAVGFILKSV